MILSALGIPETELNLWRVIDATTGLPFHSAISEADDENHSVRLCACGTPGTLNVCGTKQTLEKNMSSDPIIGFLGQLWLEAHIKRAPKVVINYSHRTVLLNMAELPEVDDDIETTKDLERSKPQELIK